VGTPSALRGAFLLEKEMERTVDITDLLKSHIDMHTFSASIAELGNSAAKITWTNALEYTRSHPLLKLEQYADFCEHLRGYGAWDREEIDAWDKNTLDALALQLIAGDLRECGLDKDWRSNHAWRAYEQSEGVGGLYRTKKRVYWSFAD
jgi:hypothetical protein